MRVLVVDDEIRLAENLARALREGPGHAVDIAHDGSDAVQLCSTNSYDLMVLDLMLPKISGDEVVRRVRARHLTCPILVLTAANRIDKTIALLNSGADDYMTKPFDLGEFIARAGALIRRGKGASQPTLQFGGLRVHTGEQSVTVHGRPVDLSPTEYRILEYLIFRPKVIVPKRELLEHLYDFTWEHHSNVIEVHISNLRKKLRTGLTDPEVLQTLRGRGYRLMESFCEPNR